MECAEMRAKLPDLAVGALTEREAAQVRAHVAACPSCAAELGGLEAVGRLLDRTEPAPAPPETWARIASRLRPRRSRWIVVLAPAAAAAVLLAVLALPRIVSPERVGAPEAAPTLAPGAYEMVSLEGDEDMHVMEWYVQGGLSTDQAARALLLNHLDHTHAVSPDGGDAD